MADGVKKINEWIMKDGRVLNITRDIDPNKLEGGTQFINPSTGLLNYVNITNTGSKLWKKYDPMVIFDPLSIKTNLIADLNITTGKLANNAVTTVKVTDLNITTEKLANSATTTIKIKDDAVTSPKIVNNAITRNKIMDLEVTLSKLAEGSVNADKIVSLSIINSNIAERTISKNKLVTKTLTNEEIADKTIIERLLGDSAITAIKIKDKAIISSKIELRNVLRTHIGLKAIGSQELDLNSINSSHIESVDGNKIIDKTITEIKLKDTSVSNRVLADLSVSHNKLDANLKDLIERSIRVEKEQSIGSDKHANTAWVKGHLIVKQPTSGNANVSIYGDTTVTGSVTASKCYNPVFADLAEAYIPTEKVEAGDPVCLSLQGGLKIEKLNKDNSSRFIGFVSDEYATVFGATSNELKFGKKVAITLVGRIKIKMPNISGQIGDYIAIIDGQVCNTGIARKAMNIGRLLENKNITDEYILCQLWP